MFKNLYIKLFILLLLTINAMANIEVIKKENSDSNTTLLIVGGIHGNEPGGFFAPAVLAQHYKITSKNLWIVPHLNKDSIQANVRGLHGDMNRKFSTIKKNDKDLKIIKEIKKIILSKNVSLILNLHDGHGFYRKKHQGSIFNPNAWGQTCVIDQCVLPGNKEFGNLNDIALTVKNNLNKNLLKTHHTFDVRNTNTKFDDETMRHSLTYFAVTHNKPAFAIESSKNLSSLSQKVFYQLLAIEEFMKIMDISFTRDFKLNEKNIKKIIKEYGTLRINNNILLDLNGIKTYLSYIPLNSVNKFEFSHPLGSVRKLKKSYAVYIGNKRITTLSPQHFKISNSCKESFDVQIDGKVLSIDYASNFTVKKSFKILKQKGIRLNIIGFSAKGVNNESGIKVRLKDIVKRFSIDKKHRKYRLEFYKNGKFCSMSTVQFK